MLSRMSRRRLWIVTAACAATVSAALLSGLGLVAEADAPRHAPASSRPPNIVIAVADDWSWPHAGIEGDPVVRTPTFDRLAGEGVRFTHAFVAAPSCTPSRAAILTGQAPHRLAEGAQLWSHLPARFAVYPDLLEARGYTVGHMGKGWGPGEFEPGGRTRNPAGPKFANLAEFLGKRPAGAPFAFWFGSTAPHRP